MKKWKNLKMCQFENGRIEIEGMEECKNEGITL